MAKSKLNQSREGMRELLTHHLRYEIVMLRWTFARFRAPMSHENEKNAFIESFCIHARNLIEFFQGTGNVGGTHAYARHFTINGIYEVCSLTKTELPEDLYGKLSEQIAHLTYGRTKDSTRQIGAPELRQLFELIEGEVANFGDHLDESFKPYWQDEGPPKFEPEATLPTNLSTSTVSRAMFICGNPNGRLPNSVALVRVLETPALPQRRSICRPMTRHAGLRFTDASDVPNEREPGETGVPGSEA
jgi:hypothetical protein